MKSQQIILIFFLISCSHHKNKLYEIKKPIIKMSTAIDSKNWEEAINQFKENIFTDYYVTNKEKGQFTTPKELITLWKHYLTSKFHVRSHHMLSNFVIQNESKNQVIITFHVIANYWAQDLEPWSFFGVYEYKMEKINKEWKISRMKLIDYNEAGNLDFRKKVFLPQK